MSQRDAHLMPRFRGPWSDTLRMEQPSGVADLGVADLQAEIRRLTKIVQKQGREVRRLRDAYAKLKGENRSTHDLIAVAEQLQDALDEAEARLEKYEAGSQAQAVTDAKRSKLALSIRYGRLHGALRALIADPATVADASQALRDVDDHRWVHDQLPPPESAA